MKISETIARLERYKTTFGDVELYCEEDDGRSYWTSGYVPHVSKQRGLYMIRQACYGGDPGDLK